MYIQSVNISFGILKYNKKYTYDYKSYIVNEVGKYKNFDIRIRQDYKKGKHFSSLICINKAGKWLKSKLKYFDENGKVVKVYNKSKEDVWD